MRVEEMTVDDYRTHCCKCGGVLGSANPIVHSSYHIGGRHILHIGKCCVDIVKGEGG